MKALTLLATLLIAQSSFALTDKIVLKLVKEDISSGRLISGKKYVDSLKVSTCGEASCELSFNYFVDGCSPYGDYCFDLECSGIISFDLATIESTVKNQECVDL